MTEKIENRQLRLWLCMLYPDNEKHENMIEQLKGSYLSYFAIKHIAKYDDAGELTNKEHYHCGIWFDTPTWLTTVIKYFNLEEEDKHLFKGLSDFRKKNGKRTFKTIDDYIQYVTHQYNDNKPDKYSFDDFITSVPDRIYNALNDRTRENHESLLALIEYIEKKKRENPDFSFIGITGWYKLCSKDGLGETYYKNWGKVTDILKDLGVQ